MRRIVAERERRMRNSMMKWHVSGIRRVKMSLVLGLGDNNGHVRMEIEVDCTWRIWILE